MSSTLITVQQRIQPHKRRIGTLATALGMHITKEPNEGVKQTYIGNVAQLLADVLQTLNTLETDYDVEYLHKALSETQVKNTGLQMDIEGYQETINDLEAELKEVTDDRDKQAVLVEEAHSCLDTISSEARYGLGILEEIR